MKINTPVTQQEVIVPDGQQIVSKTDLKGQITYVNPVFVQISGFSEAELLGQPHNIVRHPDMPVEAFEDLWNSLKEGRPWTGYVKNRCKNGDYYWVEAHAAPIWEGTQLTGYMSVRRAAPRAAVEACEAAYQLFREKRASGLMIRDGRVVKAGAVARLGRSLADASLAMKFMLSGALVTLLVMMAVTFVLGQHTGQLLGQQATVELNQSLAQVKSLVALRAAAMESESLRVGRVVLAEFTDGFSLAEGGDLPLLKHGNTVLTRRFAEVDRLAAATGGYVTLQARKGDDFIRVSSSLKNDQGERDIGSAWGEKHPAYKAMMAGQENFSELVVRAGKEYQSAFLPLKDGAGKVVGALTVGLDISKEAGELKKSISALKVGETGYFYVIDSTPGKDLGKLIVHPASQGKNIYGAKDASGREFIREMLEQGKGTIRYPWINADRGETVPRDKVVVFDTYAPWHWLIGGGSYVDEIEAISVTVRRALWVSALVVVLALVTAIYILMRRLVTRPLLNDVLPAFRSLSGGHYDSQIDTTRHDEIGQVLQGLESMQSRLGVDVAEINRLAAENLRVRIALDNVSTGVMIADNQRNIIYTNKSVQSILKGAEEDIRQALPNFNADRLLGSNIDQFHKNPQHQANLLATMTSSYTANLEIGSRHMTVSANPVISESGERLGSVAEWRDRTAEVLVEKEVQSIIFAAAQGNFDKRLATEGKQGFFEGLAIGLNQLLETTASGMRAVAEVLQTLSEGDLTRQVEGEYHGLFGQLQGDTNATIQRLREVVGRIHEATETINTAAQEIASGNQDLSSRTEEQASSLEETASSMEQLTSTVKQNSANADQANRYAVESQQVAVTAGDVVGRVVATMSAIHHSSSKIADIIGVIDGIAFQTNILALNAAVEAARAGEQGRGFAVVATEVRNLAQRSAAAAKEIKGLISDSVEKVENGNKLVDQAGRTMEEVVASIKRVAKIMADISDASREQSSGIEQVSLAVSQMDEVTQQNAALVEEAAAAAESLEEQAHSLVRAVSIFRMSEGGGAKRLAAPQKVARPEEPRSQARQEKLATPGRKAAPQLPHSLDDEWEEF